MEEEILIKQLQKGDTCFSDIGTIGAEESPAWMRWVEGGSDMFLWTDKGLYQEGKWDIADHFQPPCRKGTYPWCGGIGKKLVSLLAGEEKTGDMQAWETDVLQ